MAVCGVIYGGRYVWWQVARGLALLMTVLAGAMPGWSFNSTDGTRVGLYHTCMRAICTTTFDASSELQVSKGLVIVNGVLAVLGPAFITINILLLTLDIGAKGRINGEKYKTFVILRNRGTFFPQFFDFFTFMEVPLVLGNLVVYIIVHMLYYHNPVVGGKYIFYVCFWVYLAALLLLIIVDLHILIVKCLHKRRVTPPENIWNPGLLENPDLYAKGGWDLVISNNI